MSLIVTPKNCDTSVKKAIQQIGRKLGQQGSPTFAGLTVTNAAVIGSNSVVLQPNTDSTTFFQVLDANGGTPIFNVDSTNERIGIGIAAPGGKLEVAGDIRVLDSGSNPRIVIGDSSGAGRYGEIGWNSASDFIHLGTQAGGVNTLVLTESGNVGIGTISPQRELHIVSSGWAEIRIDGNTGGVLEFCDGATALSSIYSESANKNLIFRTNGATQALEIGSDLLATFAGAVSITTIAAEGSGADKFLVDSSGLIKYRTGAGVLADIGGQAQGDVLDDLNTLGAVGADSEFLVGTGAGALAWENAATAATSMGVGEEDTPTFAGIDITGGGVEITTPLIGQPMGLLLTLTYDDDMFHVDVVGDELTLGRTSTSIIILSLEASKIVATDSNKVLTSLNTDITAAELEELSDSSETTLHSHAVIVSTGSIIIWTTDTAPTGWLLCYGQAVSRTTYATLYAVVSTTFGVGDGSTTFNLPDMRGRVPLGQDDMGGSSANRVTNAQADSIGGAAGAETHTLTEAEMPEHKHTVPMSLLIGQGGAESSTGMTGSTDTSLTGSGDAHNNMSPYITLNYIIKF